MYLGLLNNAYVVIGAVHRREGRNVDSFTRDSLGPVLAAATAARSLGASLAHHSAFR